MAKQNGTSAKVWLAMLKEGGRMCAKEAAKLAPDMDSESVRCNLNAMVDNGAMARFDPEPGMGGARFGVTPACRIPNGLTIGEVLEALQESAPDLA